MRPIPTTEQKARAWEMAADIVDAWPDPLEYRTEDLDPVVIEHLEAIVASLRQRAAIIRRRKRVA